MKQSLHLSASQTAMLCGAGGLMMATSFLLPGLFYARFQHASVTFRGSLVAPPFVLGATLIWLAGKRLNAGINDRRWPSTDIETLRTNMGSGLWKAAYIACMVVWAGSLFMGGRIHLIAWAALPLSLTINSLHNNLKRPNGFEPGHSLAGRNVLHLRSEHWGER